MTRRVSVARLEAHFFEIMVQVCRGERFSITENRRTVGRLLPVPGAVSDASSIKALEELAVLERQGASIDEMRKVAKKHRL
jgi:antitoxin (DNA-binding transcriptional repressor) of toxin-antitoxin stability system